MRSFVIDALSARPNPPFFASRALSRTFSRFCWRFRRHVSRSCRKRIFVPQMLVKSYHHNYNNTMKMIKVANLRNTRRHRQAENSVSNTPLLSTHRQENPLLNADVSLKTFYYSVFVTIQIQGCLKELEIRDQMLGPVSHVCCQAAGIRFLPCVSQQVRSRFNVCQLLMT